ncbi:MAG: hypothetical protein HLX50_01450 [Alteromonadaceae bacterium]|nr:hypothetical protein [Alteromonadaceae bacterium]
MSPDQHLAKQAGAGLPIALFIVTVLSLIVLGMSQLQESSGNAISLQIQSQRAFFAAESGAQIALARILPGTNTASEVSEAASDEGVDGWTVSFDKSGLKECQATIEIQTEEITDENTGITSVVLVRIGSTGACGNLNTPDYTEREIEVVVK